MTFFFFEWLSHLLRIYKQFIFIPLKWFGKLMELIHEFDVMNDICKREHQKMITECDADQFYYLRMHVFFFLNVFF